MWIAVALPFALALIAPFALPRLGRAAGLAAALVPLGSFGYFAAQIGLVASGAQPSEAHPWVPALGLELALRLDGLSLVFALLISGLGALVFVYAGGYFEGDRRLPRLLAWLALFQGSMLGLVLADDLVLLFVFWELTSISSYFLIGFDTRDETARRAASQALLVTAAGGLALLVGFLLIGAVTGTFELSRLGERADLVRASAFVAPIAWLVLAGALTKSAQVPFHFWLPDAMAAPTPVSAYLHSATMVQAGVYLALRLQPVFAGVDAWSLTLQIAGAATFLVGAVIAVVQTDAKRLLAYSTVSALGGFVLLAGLGSELASISAVAAIFAHALYKCALFLTSGAVDHETGSRDVSRLGGLLRSMPRIGVAALLAAASMAGVPPLFGFVAKELVLESSGATWSLISIVAVGSALTVAVALRVAWEPFCARKPDAPRARHDASAALWIGPALLALAGLAFGLAPSAIEPLLLRAASDALGRACVADFAAWHGFTPTLALSCAVLAAGIGIYAARVRVERVRDASARLSRFGAQRSYERALASTLALGSRLAARAQSGRLRVYVAVCVVALCALGAHGLWRDRERIDLGVSKPLSTIGIGLAAVVVLAAVATATSRSRLASVVSLGAVGYGVALLYLVYGAPDLAMTQFAMETLSVLLFVLVLRRLPRFVPHGSARDRAKHLALACLAGLFMGFLTLAASPPAANDRLARWFSENAARLANGRNVVNVILVDFRALDTLGEITVLAAAAIGVFALVKLRAKEGQDA